MFSKYRQIQTDTDTALAMRQFKEDSHGPGADDGWGIWLELHRIHTDIAPSCLNEADICDYDEWKDLT